MKLVVAVLGLIGIIVLAVLLGRTSGFTDEFRSQALTALTSVRQCPAIAERGRVDMSDVLASKCPDAKLAASQAKVVAHSKADRDAADLIADFEYYAENHGTVSKTFSLKMSFCESNSKCIKTATAKYKPEENRWASIASQMDSLTQAIENNRPSSLSELTNLKAQRHAELVKEVDVEMSHSGHASRN